MTSKLRACTKRPASSAWPSLKDGPRATSTWFSAKHYEPERPMSVRGQKRKWWHFQNMSAVPPTTEIRRGERHVCFVPEADSCNCNKKTVLFDHLVGAEEKRLRNVEAQRLGRLQIDEQLKPCRLLHRKITGIGAFEYHVEVARRLADHLRDIRSIGDQAACLDPCTPSSHQRQALPIGKLYDALRIGHRVPRRHDVEAVDAGLLRRFKCSVEFSRIVYSDR